MKAAEGLEQALRTEVNGDVLFDTGSRVVYSTDASNYRHVPVGVVRPRDIDAVLATIAVAGEHGMPIVSRGAGTSVAGNACGPGLVIDFARHLDQVIMIDADRHVAQIQPGAVLDALQAAAAPHGLVFGPDPSTHSRCTLGGMIGNNACGAHSVAWGKTVDNVEALDVALADGTRLTLGATSDAELARIEARGDRVGQLYRDLNALRVQISDEVRRSFPALPRRVSGYNLDQLLPENGSHLARALVGSEGTCVVLLGATVRLVPAPLARVLVVLGFADIYASADNASLLREANVLAVEGIDDNLVAAVRQRNPASPALAALPAGASWLFVETPGETLAEAEDTARRVVTAMAGRAESVLVTDPTLMRQLWRIREEGAGLATRMPDGGQAWSGWEDAAVPPDRLGSYLRQFDALLRRYGRRGITYGHYGDGCLHVRIDFDLASRRGAAGYRSFLRDAAELVVAHGGSLSGEHGDGQARSELLPTMYPPSIIDAFQRFKAAFDPRNLLNPGRIVDPLPLDADLRVLVAPARLPTRAELALPEDGGDLGAASQRCVGVGKCLNARGGVMCPSYRVTREERHSTRGRARLLFELLAGQLITDGWRSREVREALDLCLGCKGCKRDCPVKVDMASYKAEFLHRHYRHRPRPLTHYSMGWLPRWLTLGQRAPRLVNALSTGAASGPLKRIAGVAPERDLPLLAGQTLHYWWSRRQHSTMDGGSRVLLFPDTFTNHFDPAAGWDAIAVLENSGFAVELPTRRVCCGLTWYSTGQFAAARRVLRRTVRTLRPWLDAGVPVVGIEPSCTAFLRHDAPQLCLEDADVHALSVAVRTFAEAVAPVTDRWQPTQPGGKAIMQMHCHAYAELDTAADLRMLAAAGVETNVLDSGCCGLAGNFGFERGHYEVSMACAELGLLPAVRSVDTDTTVLADGFSCRTQIRQASDVEPVHAATLVARALGSPRR